MVKGACMVKGVCMAMTKGSMCGKGVCMAGGHAWQGGMLGRGHAWQRGAYMAKGACMHVGETATEAGSTHPTGMHSCSKVISVFPIFHAVLDKFVLFCTVSINIGLKLA